LSMAEPIKFFETITIETPRESIYRRLGYRKSTTVLSSEEKRTVDRVIDHARSLVRLKGAALRAAIEDRDEKTVVLAGGARFRSSRLAVFLEGCDECLVMGATGGGTVMEAIASDTARDNLTEAVIVDAAASEMVDASLDWITRYYAGLLRRERKGLLKRRYSAGYGDFALEHQHMIYEMLDLARLDVTINEQALLIPEKSVTAITGIRTL